MTTVSIPEGKVVDRIEFEDGAMINIIYKEDRPKKNKPVAVLCETDAHTCLYRDKAAEKIVMFRPDHKPNTERYVPVRSAKAGEFVVVPDKEVREIIDRLNNRLDVLRRSLQGKSHNLSTLAAIQGVYDCCGQLEYSITEQGK